MKKQEKSNINLKNIEKYIILIFAVFVVFIFSGTVWAVYNRANNTEREIILYRNENPINLEKIIKENIDSKVEEGLLIEEIDLEYTTIYEENPTLPKGTIQVLNEGRDGRKNIFILRKYKDGEIISEEVVQEKVIKDASNRVVEVGTGSGSNNYKPKVGDIVYVTTTNMALRMEPDKNSEKVATLMKNSDVKIISIHGEWIYIEHRDMIGYIPIDCITNLKALRRK